MKSYLGLCQKAGKLISGETGVLNAIRSGEALLVIIAEDASDNTRKRFEDKCAYYQVECITYGTVTEIGHAIGKSGRAVLAVTDQGFVSGMKKKLER